MNATLPAGLAKRFIPARRPGDNLLAGVSTRTLVRVSIHH